MPRELARPGWEPVGYHIVFRLEGDRSIATEPAELRDGARALYDIGRRYGLLAFRFVDTHLHTVHVCGRREAGLFARYAASSLRWRLALRSPFEPSRFRPVLDRGHLYNTVRYVFRQEEHHGAPLDPDHEGSSLPELLGLRVGGEAVVDRVRRTLPRLTRDELLDRLGARGLDATPPCFDALGTAAAAAVGIRDLHGADPRALVARRAAVHAAGPALTTAVLAAVLEITPRAVQRLRVRPTERTLVRAVVLQMRLRALRAAAAGPRALAGAI